MNQPKTVKVLGKTYRILFVDLVDDDGSSGSHSFASLEVRLDKNLHAEVQAETLLHELIHAVEEHMDLELTEKQVHGLSVGLFQVLRDNRPIASFISKSKKGLPDECEEPCKG